MISSDPLPVSPHTQSLPGIIVCFTVLTVCLAASGCVFGLGGGGVSKGCAVTVQKGVEDELLLTWQGGVELPDVEQYAIFVNDQKIVSGIRPPRIGETERIPVTSPESRVTVVVTYLDGRQETIYNGIPVS